MHSHHLLGTLSLPLCTRQDHVPQVILSGIMHQPYYVPGRWKAQTHYSVKAFILLLFPTHLIWRIIIKLP